MFHLPHQGCSSLAGCRFGGALVGGGLVYTNGVARPMDAKCFAYRSAWWPSADPSAYGVNRCCASAIREAAT
eukprot:13153913-Alexandrium_andersonii.AAC.1